MASKNSKYPATLDIDYPDKLDRLTSFFRVLWSIPIFIILLLLTSSGSNDFKNQAGQQASTNGGGMVAALFVVTALMILFRQTYPRWWFDFNLELNRFSTRVSTYVFLMTDHYPSTIDEQTVHLNITYPNVKKDLNRWLPLVKWFLAIPHYFVMIGLFFAAAVVTVIAWFAILITGKYPKNLFNFMVGVTRYGVRLTAYTFMLTTDKYPPFSLK